MVDAPYYEDIDLEARREEARRMAEEYFDIKQGDDFLEWTFGNGSKSKQVPVNALDYWLKGYASAAEYERESAMLKELNPSDICISTNHALFLSALRWDCTSASVRQEIG